MHFEGQLLGRKGTAGGGDVQREAFEDFLMVDQGVNAVGKRRAVH